MVDDDWFNIGLVGDGKLVGAVSYASHAGCADTVQGCADTVHGCEGCAELCRLSKAVLVMQFVQLCKAVHAVQAMQGCAGCAGTVQG